MPLTDILLTSLVISIFCAGLSLISRKGNIFYFLRKPFDNWADRLEEVTRHLDLHGTDFPTFPEWYNEKKKLQRLLFVSKPLIMCCTCMASIWGIVIYHSLHGWAWQMIICCIASAFLNTLFINLIEKLES